MGLMPFEVYDIAQGKIMIAFSDKNVSVGTLHINPKQELSKHNRPVMESLFQLKGKCVMKVFDGDACIKETVLNEGESIEFPQEQFHIHSNPFDEESVTFWKASGDITKIIDDIRNSKPL